MSHIHIYRHGEAPAGPFPEDVIRARVAAGTLVPTDFAWREGLAEWMPLEQVVNLLTLPPPPPPPPVSAKGVKGARASRAARKRVPPVHVMTGMTEFLEVFPDHLTITPKGGEGLKTNGSQGIRTIPMQAFAGIGFKLPPFTSGSLEFKLTGEGVGSRGKPVRGAEANLFRFMKTDENVEAAALVADYVEGRIREFRLARLKVAPESESDELNQLAALREQGVLTEAEFQRAKQRLG